MSLFVTCGIVHAEGVSGGQQFNSLPLTRNKLCHLSRFGGDALSNGRSQTCFLYYRLAGLHATGLFRHPVSVTETRKLYADVCAEGLHKLKEQEDPHQVLDA